MATPLEILASYQATFLIVLFVCVSPCISLCVCVFVLFDSISGVSPTWMTTTTTPSSARVLYHFFFSSFFGFILPLARHINRLFWPQAAPGLDCVRAWVFLSLLFKFSFNLLFVYMKYTDVRRRQRRRHMTTFSAGHNCHCLPLNATIGTQSGRQRWGVVGGWQGNGDSRHWPHTNTWPLFGNCV